MDRNSIIGFILIAVILIGYTMYTMPSEAEQAAFKRQQDSLATVAIEEQQRAKELELNKATVVVPTTTGYWRGRVRANTLLPDTGRVVDSLRIAEQVGRWGIFHPASTGTAETVVLESARLQVSLNTHGARPDVMRLKEYTTYGQEPLLLADPDSGNYEWRFFLGNRDISTKDLYFTVAERTATSVTLKAATSKPGAYLAIHYTLDTGTLLPRCAHRTGRPGGRDRSARNVLHLGPAGHEQREAPAQRTAEVRRVLQVLQRRPRLPERDRGRGGET